MNGARMNEWGNRQRNKIKGEQGEKVSLSGKGAGAVDRKGQKGKFGPAQKLGISPYLPVAICVTSGKLPNLSEPLRPQL